MNIESLNNLNHFTGTEKYHRHFGGLLLTDGAKYLAENAECYWLFDVIASYQHTSKIRNDADLREMQFWTLTVQNGKGVVICERDTDDVVITQKISSTDFPLPKIKIYVCGNVAMLPSEY